MKIKIENGFFIRQKSWKLRFLHKNAKKCMVMYQAQILIQLNEIQLRPSVIKKTPGENENYSLVYLFFKY